MSKQESYIEKLYNSIEKMSSYKDTISKNPENIKEIIELYKYVKKSLDLFYKDGEIISKYGMVLAIIMSCEAKLPKRFIIESNPNFNYYKDDRINKPIQDEELLDKLVLKTRKELLNFYSLDNPNDVIKKICFTNNCYDASTIFKAVCDDNDIKSYMIELNPGYSNRENLCNGNCFHYFNIVYHNKKYFLVDCTYRQFFKIKGNFLEKIGILNIQGCLPGTFMLMDEERKKVAQKILKDGWIELDDNVLKHYLDGFTISYRNGLYYEKTNDYSYTTEYTTDDYIRFLKGEDNQINHEGKEVLGYQKRPSK